jgi:predicted transposase/invertase (TIGR01784 family)
MKLPENERKAYEHYQEDLHYQASMFESTYIAGYNKGEVSGEAKGKAEGEVIGVAKGIDQATRNIALNFLNQGVTIGLIATATGLSEADINQLVN